MRNLLNSVLGRYHGHPEAMIISCYFNPTNSNYRWNAFNKFIKTISHLDYRIIECVIGDSEPHLKETDKISRVYTPSLLWHKETLLNKIISELPERIKYVFWVDADVIFTNKKWIVEGVEAMKKGAKIIQPFEYCVHLEKDKEIPNFDLELERITASSAEHRHSSVWRSFCANVVDRPMLAQSNNYDVHGHVGFAWAAQREVLDKCPLYDKALIGGADHIIAHAATGQIGHNCISKAFVEDMDAINEWSRKFHRVVRGKIGYVKGDLFHIWHGSLEQRQYLKRIRDTTKAFKQIEDRDKNGLFVNKNQNTDNYLRDYFDKREVGTRRIISNPVTLAKARAQVNRSFSTPIIRTSNSTNNNASSTTDDGFATSFALGYLSNSSLIGMAGGNPAGAILGEMMNTSENVSHDNITSHNAEACHNPSHHHNNDAGGHSLGESISSDTNSSHMNESSNFS